MFQRLLGMLPRGWAVRTILKICGTAASSSRNEWPGSASSAVPRPAGEMTQNIVDDLSRRGHGRFHSRGAKGQHGIHLVEVPGQAGAEPRTP